MLSALNYNTKQLQKSFLHSLV